jgi:hypothetical protein
MASSGTSSTKHASSPTSRHPADDSPVRPSADYLRLLIRSLMGDPSMAPEIREECGTLMLAINGNDLEAISRSLARLGQLATVRGIALPALHSEA